MALPPLLRLPNENAYRDHFLKHYVASSPVQTFDGIEVRFFAHTFDHAFFTESVRGSGAKDKFDWERARRMDWIATVLRDPSAEVYRRTMPETLYNIPGRIRRIALAPLERYAVIIAVEANLRRANFVTAYVVNSDSALNKMRSNAKWHK